MRDAVLAADEQIKSAVEQEQKRYTLELSENDRAWSRNMATALQDTSQHIAELEDRSTVANDKIASLEHEWNMDKTHARRIRVRGDRRCHLLTVQLEAVKNARVVESSVVSLKRKLAILEADTPAKRAYRPGNVVARLEW